MTHNMDNKKDYPLIGINDIMNSYDASLWYYRKYQ